MHENGTRIPWQNPTTTPLPEDTSNDFTIHTKSSCQIALEDTNTPHSDASDNSDVKKRV